tara:strand:+ start:387 stop:707 length:321 start_codon:yes stop_codon:yes gene_type:complete
LKTLDNPSHICYTINIRLRKGDIMAKSETNFKSGFVKGEKEFGMKKVNDCGKVTWYVGYFKDDSFEETYVSRFRKFAWMAYERAFDNPHGLGLTKEGEEEISVFYS